MKDRSPPQEVQVVLKVLLPHLLSEHTSLPLLGRPAGKTPFLPVNALQPTVAFTVRVDAVSQPSADLPEARGLPVRLVGREAFKFRVVRVKGNDLYLADLTAVLDHLLNEGSQFIQELLASRAQHEGKWHQQSNYGRRDESQVV